MICIGERREPAKRGVRAVCVIIYPPSFDDASSIIKPIEEMFVEALIAQATIEALDEGILSGFAGRDIVPFDFGILDPFEDRMAGQFGGDYPEFCAQAC